MTYTAYRVDKSPEVWDALVKGFGARDVPALGPGLDLNGGTAVIGGLDRGSFKLLREARDRPHPYLFVDAGYMAVKINGKRARYRVVPDAYNHCWVNHRRADMAERFESLAVSIEPWRKTGRDILVCTSSDTHAEFFGLNTWAETVAAELRTYTDRPVIVRDKAAALRGEMPPFAESLKTAHAVVAWSSAVAIEAALAGVPVFTGPESAALPMNAGRLQDIESPRYPEFRHDWACSLAWGQFTVEEIGSGLTASVIDEWRRERT